VNCLSAAVVRDALVRGEASTNIGDKHPGAVTIGSEFRMGLRRTHCHENGVESEVYHQTGVDGEGRGYSG
jgi:hypothetical protein